MKSSEIKRTHFLLVAVAVSVIALSLSACNKEEPRADSVGKDIDRPVDKPGQQMGQAPENAGKQIDPAASVAGAKTGQRDKVIDDAAVAARVTSTLLSEPGLHDLKVDTAHGVVTLRGMADTSEIREKAELVALNVEGVRSVRNSLVIADRS